MNPEKEDQLSSFKIILYGQLIVNIPVILIMLVIISIAIVLNIGWIPTAILASGVGWYAWGQLIEKWKFWAINQGVSRTRLFRLGKLGLINFYYQRIFFDKENKK